MRIALIFALSIPFLFLLSPFFLLGESEEEARKLEGQPIKSIYWSDGDSGRITLEGNACKTLESVSNHSRDSSSTCVIKFRLKDVDAPETGGVGSRGGAKCEAERELGYEAKAFMVDLSRQPLVVSSSYGEDAFGRVLVKLKGTDGLLSDQAIEKGHLAPWDYDRRQPKPGWCG